MIAGSVGDHDTQNNQSQAPGITHTSALALMMRFTGQQSLWWSCCGCGVAEGNPSVGRLPGVGVGSPTSWYYAVAGAAAAIMFAVATCILVRIIKQHVFARRRGRRGGRWVEGCAGANNVQHLHGPSIVMAS
jgi:hypothetical protein